MSANSRDLENCDGIKFFLTLLHSVVYHDEKLIKIVNGGGLRGIYEVRTVEY
jgi:hypothetical protein